MFPALGGQNYAELLRAVERAVFWHGDQKRQYSGEPYIVHLLSVASKMAMYTDDLNLIKAGILHDVLEDNKTIPREQLKRDICNYFGIATLNYVIEVTDEFTHEAYPTKNRNERKEDEANRIATISDGGIFLKAWDSYDNTSSIVCIYPDPEVTKKAMGFARTYLPEKARLFSLIGDRLSKIEPATYLQLKSALEKAERALVQYTLSLKEPA